MPGVVLRGETPSEGDLTRYHRPVKAMMVRLWDENSGRTPQWTPYLASGQPFRANPHFGAAHPTALMFRVLPFDTAFLVWVLLPLPLGAAAMFLLLRELGRRRETSLLMSAAWGCGGLALSTVAMPPVAWTALLGPGAAALVVRAVSQPSRGRVVLAAASLALCAGGGSPVSIIATGVVIVAAILDWRISRTSQRQAGVAARAALFRLVVVGVLGGALAAPVVVPAVALTQRSIRAATEAAGTGGAWSFPTVRLLEPWLPTVGGSSRNDRWAWSDRAYADRMGAPLVASVYPGVLVSVLAMSTVFSRKRAAIPWLAASVFGGVAALGPATPFWGAVASRLPLVGGVRYPEKWVVLPAIAAAILAASALDDVLAGDRKVWRAVSVGLVVVGSLGFGLALAGGLGAAGGILPMGPEDSGRAVGYSLSALISAVVAIGTWLVWRIAPSIGWRWGVVAIAAILAVDLVVAGRCIVPTSPAEDLDVLPASLAPLAESGRYERMFDLASWQPRCRPLHPALQPRPVQWGIPIALDYTYDLTQLEETARAVQEIAGVGSSRPDLFPVVLARRGITAVFTCPPDLGAVQLPALEPVPFPRPRISCAERVAFADGPEGWADVVRSLTPEELRATTVVDYPDPEPVVEAAPCRVGALEASPDQWHFTVSAAGPGPSFVVIAQTWDRFWRVRVDGSPASFDRTEIDLGGMWLEPGDHVVELEYRDPAVASGNAIGLAGVAACAGLLLIRGRSRRVGGPGSDGSTGGRIRPRRVGQ